MGAFLEILAAISAAIGITGLFYLIVCTFGPEKFFYKFDWWSRKRLIILCATVFLVGLGVLVTSLAISNSIGSQLRSDVKASASSQGLTVTDIDWRGVTIVEGSCKISADYSNGVFTLAGQSDAVAITPALMSQLCAK